MALFKGKKDSDTLMSQVTDLREQGMSDKEIVEDLRDRGHKNQEILEALKQADIKGASGMAMRKAEPALEEEEENVEYPSPKEVGFSSEDIEAVAEKIIADKWQSVEKEIKEMKSWKESASTALDEIDSKVKELASALDRIKISVAEKVSSYSKGLEDVSTDIQAMDKVFKKVLPEFTGNVKQLAEIVEKFKGKKG